MQNRKNIIMFLIILFIRNLNSTKSDKNLYSKYLTHTHTYIYMVEWSRALDVRLSELCCSVSMVSSNPVEGRTNI